MRFVFIRAERVSYPVRVLCAVLEVSRSGYSAWLGRPEPARTTADAQLTVEIAAVHKRSRATYGSPRVHRELRARGLRVSRKRVERLMRDRGSQARRKKRFRRTTDSKHANPIAPNVLARKFEVKTANAVWVTDVTCVWTDEGWLFLAVMLDLFARRVVGWAASDTNDSELALAALGNALRERNPGPGLVHHSDRGSPYASGDYRRALEARGIVASMSRKGDCWDNAVAESFFATIKAELIEHTAYATRDAAIASIADYIERFYNPQRRHSHLDYVSPIEFELKAQVAALAA
jgi:transposase InsO family protein